MIDFDKINQKIQIFVTYWNIKTTKRKNLKNNCLKICNSQFLFVYLLYIETLKQLKIMTTIISTHVQAELENICNILNKQITHCDFDINNLQKKQWDLISAANSKHYSDEFIREYADKLNWHYISKYQDILNRPNLVKDFFW